MNNSLLQMNDWEIKKFLKVVLAIQIAMWGVIGLDLIGLQIPILRQFIGFIYLTFVPGILILRILKLHKLGNIETLLYTVGLSLATLMFTGFFMNMVYPLFGISGPISIMPLIITISVVVLMLCVLSYIRDKDFSDPSFIDVGEVLSPPVLFLCLIPFLAIFGTYLVNFYHTNILLMLMIVVIAFVALLIGFDKFIPAKLYPLAIWVMAISLIYHDTLISMYLNRYDVIGEYYFSKLVVIGSYWNWMIPSSNNAMLSTTMLAPIFHHIFNMDLTWVFKIIYPLLFSLVPLGLYCVFKRITDRKIAFLSSFYFISLYPFYNVIPSQCKQSIAEIFFILLFMLIFYGNIDKIKKSFLLIIFAISLIVSHYGTSYLFMFSLIFVFFFLFLTENQTINNLWEKNHSKFRKKEWIADNSNVENKAISLNFVLLFITFALTWYIYISSSSIFNTIVDIGDHILNTLFIQFLSPEYSRGMHSLAGIPVAPIRWVSKIINWSAIFFICVGILKLSLRHREIKFEKEYIGFSLYWFIICISAIAVSGFAVMNPYRLYHLSLFLLAPLAVIGGITVFEVITKILKKSWTNKSIKKSLKVLYVFFIIFLLFNTGFIFEIVKDPSSSISLSQESVKEEGHSREYICTFINLMHEQDVFSARWLSKNMEKGPMIYVIRGNYEGAHALNTYGMVPSSKRYGLTSTTRKIREGDYIYLTYLTVVEGITVGYNFKLGSPTFLNITNIHPLLEDKNKIYTNGGSEILWS